MRGSDAERGINMSQTDRQSPIRFKKKKKKTEKTQVSGGISIPEKRKMKEEEDKLQALPLTLLWNLLLQILCIF